MFLALSPTIVRNGLWNNVDGPRSEQNAAVCWTRSSVDAA